MPKVTSKPKAAKPKSATGSIAAASPLSDFPSSDDLESSLEAASEADHPLLDWARQVNKALIAINALIRHLAETGPRAGQLRVLYDTVNGKAGAHGNDGKSIRELLALPSVGSDPLDPKTVDDLIKLIDRVVTAASAKAALPATPADEKTKLNNTITLVSSFEDDLKTKLPADPAPEDFKNEVRRQIETRHLDLG